MKKVKFKDLEFGEKFTFTTSHYNWEDDLVKETIRAIKINNYGFSDMNCITRSGVTYKIADNVEVFQIKRIEKND